MPIWTMPLRCHVGEIGKATCFFEFTLRGREVNCRERIGKHRFTRYLGEAIAIASRAKLTRLKARLLICYGQGFAGKSSSEY